MSQVQAQTQETKREYRRSPQVVLRLSRDERKTLFAFAKAHVRKARIAVKEALKEAQSLAKKEAAEEAKAKKLADKEAAKEAKVAAKEAAKAAKIAEKESAKEAKVAEKEAEKAAKKAERELAKEAKAAAKRGEQLASKMAKKERDDAGRECVKRLTGDEKSCLVERYLIRVVGEEVDMSDVDGLVKKVKASEWRKMVMMNWDEQGEGYIPEAYKKADVVEVGV